MGKILWEDLSGILSELCSGEVYFIVALFYYRTVPDNMYILGNSTISKLNTVI